MLHGWRSRRAYESRSLHSPPEVDAGDRVGVEAELPRPGILVLSEAWLPGWVASVDGARAEILRANYVLRGIELSEGRHHVCFDYRPVSVALGAALSLLGLLIVALLLWIDRRRAPG